MNKSAVGRKLRVGIVGLGGIAQKAYLPILTQALEWQLIGAFSPNQIKAQPVCDSYRMRYFSRLDALAAECDAIFVHSSTASHFQVVSELLKAGFMFMSINRWLKPWHSRSNSSHWQPNRTWR